MPRTTKKAPAKRTTQRAAVNLVLSEDKVPRIELKPGMRFEVASVAVVDEKLTRKTGVGARLCGGTSTCLALIDLDIYSN